MPTCGGAGVHDTASELILIVLLRPSWHRIFATVAVAVAAVAVAVDAAAAAAVAAAAAARTATLGIREPFLCHREYANTRIILQARITSCVSSLLIAFHLVSFHFISFHVMSLCVAVTHFEYLCGGEKVQFVWELEVVVELDLPQ